MEDYIVKTCPFCKTDIQEGDAIKVCPACGISHHEACWEENKGCMTFGCSEQHHEEQHTNSPDICQNCGAPFGDGQDFCHKCGTKRNATSTIINMNKDKSPKKRALIGVLISAVALAIVLIIALYVYPKYITPQINLSKAESAFKSLDYVSAVDYYEKSGFQNDDENVSQYTYAVAITQFESKDYREAAKNFNKTGKLLDSENKG